MSAVLKHTVATVDLPRQLAKILNVLRSFFSLPNPECNGNAEMCDAYFSTFLVDTVFLSEFIIDEEVVSVAFESFHYYSQFASTATHDGLDMYGEIRSSGILDYLLALLDNARYTDGNKVFIQDLVRSLTVLYQSDWKCNRGPSPGATRAYLNEHAIQELVGFIALKYEENEAIAKCYKTIMEAEVEEIKQHETNEENEKKYFEKRRLEKQRLEKRNSA